MIVSYDRGFSVLSTENLPIVQQQVQEELASLDREITSCEQDNSYQKTVWYLRKACAQIGSILCCPVVTTFYCVIDSLPLCCLLDFSFPFSNTTYYLTGNQYSVRTCCPRLVPPALDEAILGSLKKFPSDHTVCGPCQKPTTHYATETERSSYKRKKLFLRDLKQKKNEGDKINAFFHALPPIPAPLQQIIIEYAITANTTNTLDNQGKLQYKITIPSEDSEPFESSIFTRLL